MRRRELVKLSKIKLPFEYKRVTCISSQTYNTSGNYVDTLYTPNQDTRVCAKMCMTKANSHSTAYGSESPRFSLLKTRADYNDMQKAEFKEILPLGTPFKVDHNKNNITLDYLGTMKITDYGTFTCSKPLYIFTLNGYIQATTQFVGSLYYFKIYENDIIQRNFTPCVRISDGSIGLYDLVNHNFHEAKGDFTYTE